MPAKNCMLPLPSSAARRTLAAIVAALAPRSPPALASTTAPLHLLPSCNKIAGAGPLLRGSSRASFRVCASSTIVPLEARLFSPFVFIPSEGRGERPEGSLLFWRPSGARTIRASQTAGAFAKPRKISKLAVPLPPLLPPPPINSHSAPQHDQSQSTAPAP